MADVTAPRYTSETSARKHLEAIRWPDGPICPHCGTVDHASRIKGGRLGLWFCNSCRKQFSVTVGTVFERSHIPLHKWLLANHLMCASKKGVSAHQLHRMLGVTYKTAWFMAHRLREAMKDTSPGPMGGEGKVVEADETFLGPSIYQFVSGEGWKTKKGPQDKMKVLTLVERGGRARSVKVETLTIREIRRAVVASASRESILATDEAGHYKRIGAEFSDHLAVHHGSGEYVRGLAGTNTVEGFFSIFKRGMKGVYQHCSEKHLPRYLAEFDFRYNRRIALGVNDNDRADKALFAIQGKRLTYRRTGVGANV